MIGLVGTNSKVPVLLLLAAAVAVASPPTVRSFELGKVFAGVKPPSFFGNGIGRDPAGAGGVSKAKSRLLEIVSDTGSGKDASLEVQSEVLSLVRYLETNAPTSPTLLTNPSESILVNGDWYLRYTQPSEPEGLSAEDIEALQWTPVESTLDDTNRLDTRKANNNGSVSFLGVAKVDTSGQTTIQTIDTNTMLFKNAVEKDFGTIAVEGYFTLDSVPNRIVAAFEKGSLTLRNGFVIDFSFLFAARAILKGGLKSGGWLETTYVDESIRIGRGNRGSLFVLSRDA